MGIDSDIRVLIADDTALYRKILSMAVEKVDGTKIVGAASDGVLALEILKRQPVDLVLLDVCMPRMDGLDALKEIERALGRVPTVRYGPRTIDLDILLYGQAIIRLPRLIIPHAGMLQRASVLVPLADIAPALRHPVAGVTVAEALAQLAPVRGVAPYPPGLPSCAHESPA